LIAILTKKLLEKLRRKSYREAYVGENVRTAIAYQIRALREQRGWSQKKLAEILGKPQSVLSRIEDPDYGKLSVQTLLEVARAFDVALLIQYVDFGEFIERTRDVSPRALEAESFNDDQFIAIDGLKPLVSHARVNSPERKWPATISAVLGSAFEAEQTVGSGLDQNTRPTASINNEEKGHGESQSVGTSTSRSVGASATENIFALPGL
jgi:transcriptional regulator with XRE-family HTH domain